ncbi:MAG: outer membrane protein assembly factor BamA [Alphaproteobacteria bacterium]|nr:outer membrane protein assembly factor BamA [Alphaproteobacteria bacterium]
MKKIAIITSFLLLGLSVSPLTMTSSFAQTTTINSVNISGNKRIENETILSYVRIQPGSQASDDEINQALKELFATGFFADVKVHVEGGQLVIQVEENPIINRIAYEGNSKLKSEQLKEEIQLRPREVLSRTKIQAAQQRILEMYRAMGRFAATVEPKVIQLDDNRCDVVFEIHEGDTTHVRKINFIGNKHFTKSKLKDALITKEYRWFRFFANDDTFDPMRFNADQQSLRQYYYDHGHPDYQQIAAIAEITPDYGSYHLNFTVDEGKPHKFGSIDVISKIPVVNANPYKPLVLVNTGDEFSGRMLERSIEKITEALGNDGYAFTEIEIKQTRNPQNQSVDIIFEIHEGPKVYIERIQFIGNDRTRDHVIRRELALHEGDAMNSARMKRSERNLKDLGYFKNVELIVEQGSSPDRVVLLVKVEEQSTGELSFSAGFSTIDGPLGTIRFIERNFMGKGQTIHSELTVSKRHQDFNVGLIEPYLFGRQLEGSIDAFAQRSTRFSSYTQVTKGLSPSIGYKITEHLSQVLSYTIKQDRVSHVDINASNFLKEQRGSYVTSEVGQTLYYDRRNSKIDPTSGYVLTLSNSFAGLGGKVKYLKHVLGGKTYFSPIEDVVMILKGNYGVMQKAGKKIRVVDSFFLGADSFRGFQYGGLGPHDNRTGDPLGGTRFWTATAETMFPIGLPNEFGVKGALFSDVGTLWRSTETGPFVRDNKYVRASWGIGLVWNSPFGPIRIDYATPFRKDKFDDTQRFLLGFQTKL